MFEVLICKSWFLSISAAELSQVILPSVLAGILLFSISGIVICVVMRERQLSNEERQPLLPNTRSGSERTIKSVGTYICVHYCLCCWWWSVWEQCDYSSLKVFNIRIWEYVQLAMSIYSCYRQFRLAKVTTKININNIGIYDSKKLSITCLWLSVCYECTTPHEAILLEENMHAMWLV